MKKKLRHSLMLSLLMMANSNSVFEAADYTSTVTINDGAAHLFSGDTTITTTSGHGLVLSGPMGSVSVDPSTDFTITANSGVGISVINSVGTPQSGNASIILGETHIKSSSYGIHTVTALSPTYGTNITLGDNSTITAQSVALNIGGNSTVTIGNNSTITGNASGSTVAAVSAANGSVINIGDDATITNTSTNGNSIAVRASDASGSALTGATVTIGNGATIYTSSTNSGSHAVKAGNTTSWLGSGVVKIGNNADISTVGSSSYGLYAENSSSILLGNDAQIKTSGASSSAVRSGTAANSSWGPSSDTGGGTIEIGDGLEITTTGSEAYGLDARYNGSVIIVEKDATIKTSGSSAYGVYAYSGGEVTLGDRATITTQGNNAYGVYAYTNAEVTFGDNATITTEGFGADGVYVIGGKTVNFGNNLTIKTLGTSSSGLSSRGSSSITTGADTTIVTQGSHGVRATNYGKVTLGDRATITTQGNSAKGVYASDATKVTLGDNATIVTQGNNSDGVYAYSGEVTLGDRATITTQGDNAFGVYIADNGKVTFGDRATIITTGSNSHGIYTRTGGSTTLNGAAIWVDDSKGSKALYTESRGTIRGSGLFHITGDLVNSANGTIDLGFLSGSQFIGASDVGTGRINLDMSDSSQWQMTKDSTVTQLGFLSGGAVSFDTATPYGILTVDQLVGDGGTFYMRTDIVGDGAGNNQSDLLTVTTSSVGDHFIQVPNSGSAVTDGTETLTLVDTSDGIAAFSLTNVVELGGYQYELRRTSADTTDWELYSTGKTPSKPVDAGVNLFSGAYLLNYAETQTVLKRLGDLRDGTHDNGIWTQVYGGKFQSGGDGFLRGFDMNYWGMQAGYDKKIEREDKKGTVYVGGFLGYSKGSLDYLTDGSGSIDSKSLGAYWTHIHRNGFYADAVLKYNWMKNDFKRLDTAGDMVSGSDINTQGFTGSLEIGRRYFFKKTENGEKIRVEDRQGWYVEPQMQVTVGQQSGGSFTASNGLRIKADSYRSVMGRAELHLGYEIKSGKNPVNVYGKLGVVKEFDGDVDYTLNGSRESTSYGDTWKLWGLGVTAKLGQKHDVYFDVERATGGQFTQSWGVNGGYRFSW